MLEVGSWEFAVKNRIVVPAARIRPQNARDLNPAGEYVLYWMTAARRSRFNFALQRAAEVAVEIRRPLLVFEPLRLDYPWASARFHAFVLQGMRANRTTFAKRAGYYPYVEPSPRHAHGLLEALARRAASVVTDWYPAFFFPRMIETAAARIEVRCEAVDGNGLIPIAQHERAFPTARGYRGFVQRTLRQHLAEFPLEDPLAELRPAIAPPPPDVLERWRPLTASVRDEDLLRTLAVDSSVAPAAVNGGEPDARARLETFLAERLHRYAAEANHPDADVTSHLSPYLHFGHLSPHEVFAALMTHERWTTRKLGTARAGAREGWWGVLPGAELFLDQLVVWRELAFNGCAWTREYHSYASLPPWARATLDAHRGDPRPHLYSLEQLDAAVTHDSVWNAAQRQLRREGWFHGYMRMVWGKKILEWCRDPEDALVRMETLMNRYSLDGRDPVSYLNYGWVLGRYDRPWPERPIFGTVRYMTSESARRKLKMKEWLRRYGTE